MDNSIFIAKVMGLFLMILSISLLVNANNFIDIINNLFQNGAIQFLVGMILVLMGILLVVSHNEWKFSWTVLITILSWLILFKGILYLIFPGYVQTLAQQFMVMNNGIYMGALINFVLGLYLSFMGFLAPRG